MLYLLTRLKTDLGYAAPILLAAALLFSPTPAALRAAEPAPGELRCDVAILGATPAGIMAAVAAARSGESVVLLEPSYVVGGMMAGGLTKTDIGRRETVGGLSFEFFARVEAYYRDKYGAGSPQVRESKGGLFFEPHVADLIFSRLLEEAKVVVRRKERLTDVSLSGSRLATLTTRHYETGAVTTVTARVFIDATYEGDLLAAAHVPYRVGREARAEYDESLAGRTDVPAIYRGTGDHRVQAYNFRSTLTNRADILVPVAKPKYYSPEPHRHFISYVNQHGIRTFEELFHDAPLWGPVNGKSDPNKADLPGANYAYAEADYEMREVIAARVRDHWLSLWWMLQNDPELPEEFRTSARRWGLPKDEFVESGNVSPQMYIREARRMLGRYFLIQNDLERERWKDDTVCLGSYNIDSHDVSFVRTPEGLAKEGYLISAVDPYEIPYRVMTPFAPGNLLVTCAVSASHIAYGSLRMEPVFMMLGQAAGLAAHLAHRGDTTVQDVSIPQLQEGLRKAGIPLKAPFRPVVAIVAPPGDRANVGEPVQFAARSVHVQSALKYYWNFDGSGEVQSTDAAPTFTFTTPKRYTVSLKVVDAEGTHSLVEQHTIAVGENVDADTGVTVAGATLTGRWDRGSARTMEARGRVNHFAMDIDRNEKTALFKAVLPRSGRYRVAFAFEEGGDRATRVPVKIKHAGGTAELTINQRERGTPFAFRPLGDFTFQAGQPAEVLIETAGTDGRVSIDEVRWLWLGP
ncbi:MAG TPA: FAD-dependent oxidoreductase [Opitutaceae bacterium]